MAPGWPGRAHGCPVRHFTRSICRDRRAAAVGQGRRRYHRRNLLPELGQCSSKGIAALAGLAPLNCDSGRKRGQRHIHGGRVRVRRALYMAALAAIRAVPRFKAYYEAVRARSGHAKVAIIAVARKLIVALNAVVKTLQPFRVSLA